MDLTTANPAEIDAEIAQREHAIAVARATVGTAAAAIERIRTSRYFDAGRDASTIAAQENVIVEANAAIAAFADELGPLRAEFTRRGGWTRYYLVDTHDGHVHSSTRCSTCFPTTAFYWLTGESGKVAEEVVDQAQSQACTVCFPWAPVTDRPGAYRTPTELERQARAAERDARAAVRRAKQITNPDGSPLRINRLGWQTIKTTRTAEIELVDILFDAAVAGRSLDTEEATAVQALLAALAAKKETTVEDERVAAQTRLAARRKRERL